MSARVAGVVALAVLAVVVAVAVVTVKREPDPLPPAAAVWHAMAAAPIPARAHPATVWTGKELVVVGGQGEDGTWLKDAAAYDPATNAWRRLPDVPSDVRPGSTAVWTGSEVVIFPGAFPSDLIDTPGSFSPVAPRALDLATPQWRDVPDHRKGFTVGSVVVDRRLVVLTNNTSGEFFVMELVGDSWVRLATIPHQLTGDSWHWVSFVDDNVAVFVAAESTANEAEATGFAVHLGESVEVAPIAQPRRGRVLGTANAAGRPGSLLVSGYLSGEGRGHVTDRYDVTKRRWTNGVAPFPRDVGRFTTTWSAVPGGVVVLGGIASPFNPDRALRLFYDEAANRWEELPVPPVDLDRAGHVAVWTGDRLVVWGGLHDLRDERFVPDTAADRGALLVLGR